MEDILLEPSATESILEFVENINYQSPHLVLKELTEHIKEGFLGYVKAGICLEKVQYLKLWKQNFRSFKEYCESALGKTLSYAKRIIEAARVCEQLILGGFKILPVCEAQARPLVKYACVDAAGNSELAEKWQQVIDASGGKITAELVKSVVDGEAAKAECKSIRIERDVYDALEAKAKLAGITPQQLLKKLVEGHIPDEPETDDTESSDTESDTESNSVIDTESTHQKFANWQKDLEQLVAEHSDRAPINNNGTRERASLCSSLEPRYRPLQNNGM